MKQVEQLKVMASEIYNGRIGLRMSAMMSAGYDFADTLHNIFLDFGYPAQLQFRNYWNMYRRFGTATAVVELPPDVCWSSHPAIESDSTQLIDDLEQLIAATCMWQRIKGLDRRQRVGRYAGLLMRVRDGQALNTPMTVLPGVESLLEMVPLYESQLTVTEEDTDPKSDTFGQPTMLQYNSAAVGSRDRKNATVVDIHPSRVVFAAEGADDGTIYGDPVLEPIYNSLMDLRKVGGGAGEGFYKNSAQSVVFDLKDAASASANEELLEKFNENYDDFARNRQRRAIWTPGMDAKTLSSDLISPKDFAQVALDDIAAGSQIPATIIIGKQTGRLASAEDSRHFLSTQQSRRTGFCAELVTNVIDWCMTWGVLPTAEYVVEWDDLLARSDSERLENAESMSSINDKEYNGGGSRVFTSDEIREAAGYEPEADEPDDGGEELDDTE